MLCLFYPRFLVFFDDGFAQYMTEKKMHLVIHSGINYLAHFSKTARKIHFGQPLT